jgi:hypothetical protein
MTWRRCALAETGRSMGSPSYQRAIVRHGADHCPVPATQLH